MADRWYAIQILPQFQSTAEFHLKRQDFTPFFPEIELRKSRAKTILQPLFKGYGFVQFDIDQDQWLSINGTRGVIHLLPKGKLYPDPMNQGFVQYLLDHNPIQEQDFEDIFEHYYPGAAVQVRDGVLEGRYGQITDIRGKFLEISFYWESKPSNAIWMTREALIPAAGIPDLDEVDQVKPRRAVR